MCISDWSSDVCSSDLNTVGADGTRVAPFSTVSVYKGIIELATIFDVQQSGIELVSELKEREAEAIDLARSLNLPEVSAVFWFSSTSIKADPRSEERRVGKECVSTCRSRWSPYH